MAMVGIDETASWFDEIDLDPTAPWLRMGTRQLGDRPWLVVDQKYRDELALKQRLCRERHDEVFAAEPDTEAAGAEVLTMIDAALGDLPAVRHPEVSGPEPVRSDDLHPLDRAGRMVQEDLCLMRRADEGWVLAAASLCFPSRWRLGEKMGRPLMDVHGPVVGYRTALADRVDSLFDRLGDRIVWRRNWFVHPDDELFQPDRPVGGDPIIPTERCRSELILRSERQTIRRLPETGWVLFTVRIQHEPLGRFIEDPNRRAAMARFVAEAPADHATHRGLAPAQVDALVTALEAG